jgi:hypothetical protein
LNRAVEQMFDAAAKCPEVYLGFDERNLMFSQIVAAICSLLRLPRPYWRYFRICNKMGLKTGIRFMFKPADTPGMLRQALRAQGYSGKLLSTNK